MREPSDIYWPLLKAKKKFRHKWKYIFNPNKLQYAECQLCPLKKHYDPSAGQVVYSDDQNVLLYDLPSCNPH